MFLLRVYVHIPEGAHLDYLDKWLTELKSMIEGVRIEKDSFLVLCEDSKTARTVHTHLTEFFPPNAIEQTTTALNDAEFVKRKPFDEGRNRTREPIRAPRRNRSPDRRRDRHRDRHRQSDRQSDKRRESSPAQKPVDPYARRSKSPPKQNVN